MFSQKKILVGNNTIDEPNDGIIFVILGLVI
jgi:hypothetical protein